MLCIATTTSPRRAHAASRRPASNGVYYVGVFIRCGLDDEAPRKLSAHCVRYTNTRPSLAQSVSLRVVIAVRHVNRMRARDRDASTARSSPLYERLILLLERRGRARASTDSLVPASALVAALYADKVTLTSYINVCAAVLGCSAAHAHSACWCRACDAAVGRRRLCVSCWVAGRHGSWCASHSQPFTSTTTQRLCKYETCYRTIVVSGERACGVQWINCMMSQCFYIFYVFAHAITLLSAGAAQFNRVWRGDLHRFAHNCQRMSAERAVRLRGCAYIR